MTVNPSVPSVSFTVNACNADASFIEPTLRHMLRALNFERVATARQWRRSCSACWTTA